MLQRSFVSPTEVYMFVVFHYLDYFYSVFSHLSAVCLKTYGGFILLRGVCIGGRAA